MASVPGTTRPSGSSLARRATRLHAGAVWSLLALASIAAAVFPVPTQARPQPLEQNLRAMIAASGAEVAVAVRTLDGGFELLIDPDKPFHAASTMKVPVMIELFRQARAGTLALSQPLDIRNEFRSIVDESPYKLSEGDDSDKIVYSAIGRTLSLEQLNEAMITVSSNFATNLLIQKLGIESIRSTVTALGADGMQVLRGVEDQKAFDKGLNNSTTARGLMVLFERLGQGRAVDADSDAKMIAVLKRQMFNDAIPAGLPRGTAVAHKTGNITRIHHDAGVVYGKRPYVIVLLVRGIQEQKQSAALMARLTKAVHAGVAAQPMPAISPGARTTLDAHNCYPYNGRFVDRIDRALATGLPVAIEQDLVWLPAAEGRPARSIVSHGAPFDGSEPSLKEYFFERIRPIVERELTEGDRARWPVITLNLDLKTNEPEHHRDLWNLLGEYEAWLTTAERTADGRPAPLDVKPVLVLTGDSDLQAQAFHDALPSGTRLRLFGAIALRAPAVEGLTPEESLARFRAGLPDRPLPAATNYRRWWNAPWAVVEAGGQVKSGEWTAAENDRLRKLVGRAHEAGLWIRLWTLNGHAPGVDKQYQWSASYNMGSPAAAERRWRAAIDAGADFVATDHYEEFVGVLTKLRPRR